MLLVVQPPPEEAPPTEIEPHVTLPEPSVCNASLPVQERIELIAKALACAIPRYEWPATERTVVDALPRLVCEENVVDALKRLLPEKVLLFARSVEDAAVIVIEPP